MNRLTTASLAGLVYFIVGTAAVELSAGSAGLGFWTWFLVLSVFGVLTLSLICVKFLSLQPKETMFAALLGVLALCLLGVSRGWFLFANKIEIAEIGSLGIACALAVSWGTSFAMSCMGACPKPQA